MSNELFTLAERIRALRANSGKTQSELAKALGITRSGVNAWEMGLSVPSTPHIVELAKYFHVTTDYLFGMDKAETFSLTGLTDEQVDAVKEVARCFRDNRE